MFLLCCYGWPLRIRLLRAMLVMPPVVARHVLITHEQSYIHALGLSLASCQLCFVRVSLADSCILINADFVTGRLIGILCAVEAGGQVDPLSLVLSSTYDRPTVT